MIRARSALAKKRVESKQRTDQSPRSDQSKTREHSAVIGAGLYRDLLPEVLRMTTVGSPERKTNYPSKELKNQHSPSP